MDLSIVIVNYRSSELLANCLASIESSELDLDYEVIIVDNASSDVGLARLEENYPQARFIRLDKNLGFAGGNNEGIKVSHGKAICLLNPDTEVQKDALKILYDRLMNDCKVGVTGPKIFFADGTLQTKVLPKKIPTLSLLLYEMFFLGKLLPESQRLNSYYGAKFDFDTEQPVEQVSGACLMIAKETVDRIGLLDQKFFLYFEETDWCLRALRAGYSVLYVPEAVIMHYEGGSSGKRRESVDTYYESELYFFKKHYGVSNAVLLYLINLVGFVFRLMISPAYLINGKRADKPRRNLWALSYHLDLRHLVSLISP